jgi:hypothetical protein
VCFLQQGYYIINESEMQEKFLKNFIYFIFLGYGEELGLCFKSYYPFEKG